MTSAQVVETSVINNSSFQNFPNPDDHTRPTTGTPGFKPCAINTEDRTLAVSVTGKTAKHFKLMEITVRESDKVEK